MYIHTFIYTLFVSMHRSFESRSPCRIIDASKGCGSFMQSTDGLLCSRLFWLRHTLWHEDHIRQ